jgi:hypothetical protein
MSDFKKFAKRINDNFNKIQGKQLLTVDLTSDELWAAYLAAFPEGSNPMFRERTEHDCNSCRHFVRPLGGVVCIDPETLEVSTVWDGDGFDYPYNVVADAMASLVWSRNAWSLFRVSQPAYGAEEAKTVADGKLERWNHLWGKPAAQYVTKEGAEAGEYLTSLATLQRAFKQLNEGAINAVIDLIDSDMLYRGHEHRAKVDRFRLAMKRYFSLDAAKQARFLAVTAFDLGVARFQGSVIGTLVEALAVGEDVEAAVRSFESKVAPQNYQRTNQVITQRMVDDAMKTIDTLGLKVGRRLANIRDVSINNVLWASGESRPLMKDGLAGLLFGAVRTQPAKVSGQATEIGIDAFLSSVLPTAQGLRVLVEGNLASNFMTITTTTEEGGPPLFKWNSPFAWSYAGGVTDMIQERVKAAGGNVDKAVLRFSLSWFNTDDLDLSCIFTPLGKKVGEHLYYGDKTARLGGLRGGLDVDMNVQGETRNPVENIAFSNLVAGTYKITVHNYRLRERKDVGFTLQTADATGVVNYAYDALVADKQRIDCLTATVDANGAVSYQIGKQLTASSQSVGSKWGLPFDQFADVSSVMLSPNYWDGREVGNKHVFFILRNAKTDEQPRGLFNEFLHPNLAKHRKVLDVIGEKTKPELIDDQLSGIGVSSTLRKVIVVQVTTANSRRVYRVQF